ncbi:unnamed protein product [Allacma fusca]|uniref:IkappaB kinase n=1 Tax=Allacma fusca TaxID=39272 RepID=A0A8J2LBP5_9HEXA|nr:unnamed protein product [Allacma fusca]
MEQNGNNNSGEDWSLEKILGKGSYGTVSLWKSYRSGDLVAVKQFLDNSPFGPTEKLASRCKDEVERMNSIDHPYIVGTISPSKELLLQLGQTMPTLLPFLCMEYCSGGDLRQLLKRPENLSGLPEKEVVAVLQNISEAIVYLHNQTVGLNRYIIHRDIKPENIVIQLDCKSKRSVYKLSDLGLAKDVSEGSLCSTILGTPEYIAPEIHQNKRYDKTVDFWSFGLIAYEISCGNLPIPVDSDRFAIARAENLTTIIPETTHLSELFRKCLTNWLPSMLEYNPENRGKYKIVKNGVEEVIICSIAWLQHLLSAPLLHVYTSVKGRLVFRVKSDTTISNVQQWVFMNTGIELEDQLVLAMDGSQVSSADLAFNYVSGNSSLYLVAKFGHEICTKIILPKNLSSFLVSSADSQTTCDVSQLKQLWIVAIFYIQCQLERTEDLLKIQNALRNRESGKVSIRMTKAEKYKMEELYRQFCDLKSRFNALVNIQEKLDEVNGAFVGDSKTPQSLIEIKASAQDLHTRFKIYFREYFDYCDSGLKLKDSNCTILNDRYDKLLQEYWKWKKNGLKNLDSVRNIISNFLASQEPILKNLDFNIKLLRQRTTTFQDREKKLGDWLLTCKSYVDEIVELVLNKQKMILTFAFPPHQS